jgi:anaerobic ribonucleoside-triphosphate reductase
MIGDRIELSNGDLIVDGIVIPISKRTICEVYSRVVGYMMPVSQWNPGKKQEWKNRRLYEIRKEDIDGREK